MKKFHSLMVDHWMEIVMQMVTQMDTQMAKQMVIRITLNGFKVAIRSWGKNEYEKDEWNAGMNRIRNITNTTHW